MSSSFIGKYLFVDLSSGTFQEKELPRKTAGPKQSEKKSP